MTNSCLYSRLLPATYTVPLLLNASPSGALIDPLMTSSYFKGTDLSGFIRAYVGDISYVAYFTLEEGSKETNYKIQLPWDSEAITKNLIGSYRKFY